MPENIDTITVVPETPKKSLKSRVFTKQNLKRGAITAAVVGSALYVKSKLNSSASVSADLHVETDNTDNSDN